MNPRSCAEASSIIGERNSRLVSCKYLNLLLLLAGLVCAQTEGAPDQVHELEQRPVFRVDVVERVTVAVNYRHRSGATRIDFAGTPLMPRATGSAKVESRQGYIEISARFENMQPL